MRLYVGGLSFNTNDTGLRRLFEEAGTVSSAAVNTDRVSGQSKGFGFVDMDNDAEAKSAITKFNGRIIEGRPLTVNEARPREDRGNSGSGGGGRSGGIHFNSGGRSW